MVLPLALSQQLVRLLDKAFSHGLRPGRDERAVCIETIRRVTQGRDTYLAYIATPDQDPDNGDNDNDEEKKKKGPSTADDDDDDDDDDDNDDNDNDDDEGPSITDNGNSVSATQPDAPSASILPDGWEAELAAWFDCVRKRGKNQNLALAFAREIDATVRSHPVKACATYQPSSSQTVAAASRRGPDPFALAPTGATNVLSLPLLSGLDSPHGPSAEGPSPPSATTPAPSARPHRFSTPEGMCPAAPEPAARSPLTKDGVCDLLAGEESRQSPVPSSPGPVYGPYSPGPQSPPRHSAPVNFVPTLDLDDMPELFAGGLLIDATEMSPILASTPALSAPPSARIDSPGEHYGSQPATPDALFDALALWGIGSRTHEPTILEGGIRPSSPESPSSPISKGRFVSSRASSPRLISSPPTSEHAFSKNLAQAALLQCSKRVASHCQTFQDLLALSHVCRDVYNALLEVPELWRSVHLYSTPDDAVLKMLLARSGSQSIRIDMVVKEPSHFANVIAALSAVAGRIEHLSVSFDNPWRVARRTLQCLLESPAPQLQSLHLHFNTHGRPRSFFAGQHQIATLSCQIWQLENIDPSQFDSVREFVALRPPPSVDQHSHSATSFFWRLRNVGLLVLDSPFNERRTMPKEYYPDGMRPLDWLVLDQRTGPESWDDTLTKATLRRTRLQDIESAVLVSPTATAANFVRIGLRDTPPEQLALLPLGGQLQVVVRCRRAQRARFLLDTPDRVPGSFHFPGIFIVHLTLAQHLPNAAVEYIAHKDMPNLRTFTLWLNDAADELEALLTQSVQVFRIGHALREIRLVAEFPYLPDVCRRYLPDPPTYASRTIAAAQLTNFFWYQSWPTGSAVLSLGDGVALVGNKDELASLVGQVGSIESIQ